MAVVEEGRYLSFKDLLIKNDEALIHCNVKGSKWYKHKFGKWQNHAKYAAGKADLTKETKDYGFNIKPRSMTVKEDLARVNRNIESDYIILPLDRINNCINCTMAYELRRRGYDVEVKPAFLDENSRGIRYLDAFDIEDEATVLTLDFTRRFTSPKKKCRCFRIPYLRL